MKHLMELEQEEWQIVLELLENESRELPSEIHHTDRSEMHEALLSRRKMVDGLIARIREKTMAPAPAAT